MIEAEWEDLKHTNSPSDIFICFIINFSSIWLKHISFAISTSLSLFGTNENRYKKIAVDQGFW